MNKDNYNEPHVSDVLYDQQQQLNNKNDSSILTEDITVTETNINIKVGTSFPTWEDAEIKLNRYARFAGFSLRRKRLELDKDGIV